MKRDVFYARITIEKMNYEFIRQVFEEWKSLMDGFIDHYQSSYAHCPASRNETTEQFLLSVN